MFLGMHKMAAEHNEFGYFAGWRGPHDLLHRGRQRCAEICAFCASALVAEPPKPYPQALDEDLHVFTMYLNLGGWLGLAWLAWLANIEAFSHHLFMWMPCFEAVKIARSSQVHPHWIDSTSECPTACGAWGWIPHFAACRKLSAVRYMTSETPRGIGNGCCRA